jgi:hypothetical protein
MQPIHAFEHPRFKVMINVASRATHGVKIPGQKATRAEIMRIFRTYLTDLSKMLNVRCSSYFFQSFNIISPTLRALLSKAKSVLPSTLGRQETAMAILP